MLCRNAIANLRRYCRLKTDVKIIIQSRDIVGRFCYSFQRVTFLHLWHRFATYKGKTLLRRAGLHPFFDPHGSKNSLRFSAHKVDSKKIGANNAPKKLPTAIFACPSFANKIISAALKLSAKNGLRPSHELTCDLSANSADKKERAYNSLQCLLTRLLL